jgi:hypothetical protein
MIAVIGILGLLILPALIGVVHDAIIDRQIRRAQREEVAQNPPEPKQPHRPHRHHGAARPV